MDTFTLSKYLTRRLDRVARETGTPPETLVRDAVKGHLDYLEWLGESLDRAEKDAQRTRWLTTGEVRRTLASETARHARGHRRQR